MRRVFLVAASALIVSCAGGAPPPLEPLPELWRKPAPVDGVADLSLEPPLAAARLGEKVTLTLHGALADNATCSLPTRGLSLEVLSPLAPGVIDVECRAGAQRASAQVTFTDAVELPVQNPYGGGVVLLKLRETPLVKLDATGRRDVGIASLERTLRAFEAWAMSAFPFTRAPAGEAAGLERWMVVDLPKTVNLYQAIALLRSDPAVLPESLLVEDASFIRVGARKRWPAGLGLAQALQRVTDGPEPFKKVSQTSEDLPLDRSKPGWELKAIGAPEAWDRVRGRDVGIAIVDTGVDRNHRTLAHNVRSKAAEAAAEADADGNGVPGDEFGANFAHIAIAHGYGTPRLAVGLVTDVSDWDGVTEGRESHAWGHGTAIASIAAGFDPTGGAIGVAPSAWILPVDVQENLRKSESQLLDRDPRMRPLPARRDARRAMDPLRSSVWARAMGVVYAADEGARIVTCAWPGARAHQLLYDAMRHAQDHCALLVCSAEPPTGDDSSALFPARWSERAQVLDTWSGALVAVDAPLGGLLVADHAPKPPAHAPRTVAAPVSNPRNDAAPLIDTRTAAFGGPGLAVGLAAGTAALVLEERPDLEPARLREILDAAPTVTAARQAIADEPLGTCGSAPGGPKNRQAYEIEPWWKRTKIRGTYQDPISRGEHTIPGSAAEEPSEDRRD